MTDKIIVLSTCETWEDARRIARHLVEARLAACVNIVPQASSIYRWRGAIEEATELLLLIKSSRPLVEALKKELARIHPYEVPELVALAVVDGSDSYLAWLDGELQYGPEP